jgi:hypothetical protein
MASPLNTANRAEQPFAYLHNLQETCAMIVYSVVVCYVSPMTGREGETSTVRPQTYKIYVWCLNDWPFFAIPKVLVGFIIISVTSLRKKQNPTEILKRDNSYGLDVISVIEKRFAVQSQTWFNPY